jgi:dienelactone hydrolase
MLNSRYVDPQQRSADYRLKTFGEDSMQAPAYATRLVSLALAVAGCASGASAQGVGRLEIHSIASVTVSNQQFLTGNRYGKPVTVGGELRLPRGTAQNYPAVILIHGSGGISAGTERWAQELNAIGVAAFILDAFTGRGIINTNTDQSQLDSIAMTHDAFAALNKLAAHPRIDASRIAVMGFSKGAVPAIYSSGLRFRAAYAPGNAEFAAHIGLYTPCNVTYKQDDKVGSQPLRLFHGIADDYVSIEPCRTYVRRLKDSGADVTLAEYPNAYHAYDNFTLAPSVSLPDAQTTRNCLIAEGDNGVLLNSKTGHAYSLDDACVEKGPHVGYNEAAHKATVEAVKQFLATRFRLASN